MVAAVTPPPASSGAEPDELGPESGDSRRTSIEGWSAALASGDGAEVTRLVRQSRVDRVKAAATGKLGAMLG